jgi:hypothetical protein
MNRDPRFALSQEVEAKQTLLDRLRTLAANDPDFLADLLEGEANFFEIIAPLDASILEDEILADGIKTALENPDREPRSLRWADPRLFTRLKELAGEFPDLSESLNALIIAALAAPLPQGPRYCHY